MDFVGFPLLDDFPQIFTQGNTILVHVDPDEPGERVAGHFFQGQLAARITFGEIFRILHLRKRSIKLPAPAVIRADQFVGEAHVVEHQTRAAVLADIVEGADRPVMLTDHDDAFRPHFFHLVIARLGNFIFPAQKQPDLGPHAFPFFLEEVCGVVAIPFDPVAAQHRLGRFPAAGCTSRQYVSIWWPFWSPISRMSRFPCGYHPQATSITCNCDEFSGQEQAPATLESERNSFRRLG